MHEIKFTVYGSPVAQPRPRAHHIKTKDGREFISVYNPHGAARQWKSDIRTQIIATCWGLSMLEGAVEVWADFYLPRPKFLMKKHDPDGRIPHIKKPDRDNLEKALLDSMKGLIFIDDGQVCGGEIRKWYHEKNGRPRVEVKVRHDL